MKLYNYFRSSAAFRVRIALNLKGLGWENAHVHLLREEHRSPDFLRLNPAGLVPILVDGGAVIAQSLAIIEYLDETHPLPPLLPAAPAERARIRSIAQAVACDIHPLNNLRVLKYLSGVLQMSEQQKIEWYAHWVDEGLLALETRLAADTRTGMFCHGSTPTMADICLIPQLANARRISMDLSPFTTLLRIEAACNALPAFVNAAPAVQSDGE